MGEQRLRVLRQSLKRCCTRSSWLAGTDIVLIGCPPSTVEWTADDTNSFSKIHAALPKGHKRNPSRCQFTTVLGVTKTRGLLHPDQQVLNATQNSLCRAVHRWRGR